MNYISPPIPNNRDKFKSLKANMASSPFPSPVELSVASALLLLHTKPSCVSLAPRPQEFDFHGSALRESSRREVKSKSSCGSDESSDNLSSKRSKSCASSLTTDGSSCEIQAQKLRAIAVVARCHGMNLQVARKSRSKVFWSSDNQEHAGTGKISTTMSSESLSTEASCVSTNSSAVLSSARSRSCVAREENKHVPLMKVQEKMKKRQAGSVSSTGLLQSRAEDILKLLSRGGSSEVKIRQALGDTPDTSKALRMSLQRKEVKRSGTGGRSDPFIYTIA